MGWGDELMGSGLAKGAKARGQRIAFGDGRQVYWTPQAKELFRNNPNVLPPDGDIRGKDVVWVPHYRGSRMYHTGRTRERWLYNSTFHATPGEIFFDREEETFADQQQAGLVIIEPNTKRIPIAENKQWPFERYQKVADALRQEGYRVGQFVYPTARRLENVLPVATSSFRQAVAVVKKSSLFVGPEGGLHHGAAAVDTPAVVIFGAFTPVAQTGYDFHSNFSIDEPCGSLTKCKHCEEAMKKIPSSAVIDSALELLR